MKTFARRNIVSKMKAVAKAAQMRYFPPVDSPDSIEDYLTWSYRELRKLAKSRSITKYYKMDVSELIIANREYDSFDASRSKIFKG